MAIAHNLAQRVLKSLGLEAQRVQSVSLRFSVNELTMADVTMFTSTEAVEGVAEALEARRFVLVDVTDEPGVEDAK